MKKLLFGAALLFTSAAVFAQKKVTINGTVSGDTKGFNKVYVYGTGVKNDTAVIKDGKFSISVPYEKPFMVLMYTEFDVKSRGMYSPFGLLCDKPGVLTLTDMDIAKGLKSATVKGIESAALYQQYNTMQGEAYKKVSDQITAKYGKAFLQEKDPRFEEFNKERAELQKQYIGGMLNKFVADHPDSYAAVIALSGSGKTAFSLEEQEAAYAKLSKRMQATDEGKGIIDFVEGVRSSSIGSFVKDFTLNTPEEKPLNFKNDLKGKYVLIDFWASWCGPCKQSFPHMKEVYSKYKSDKFEIYSISIDKDKEAWLKGVKEQDLPWVQTLDTKNISHKGFAVTGVPTTYLISPEGKILAKEVGFDPSGNSKIEKMLVELFGDKGIKKQDAAVQEPVKKEASEGTKPVMMKAMKMQ